MPSTPMTGRLRAAALALVAAISVGLLGAPTAAAPVAPAAPRQDGGEALKNQYDDMSAKEITLLRRVSEAQQARVEATGKLQQLERQTAAKQLQLLDAQGHLQKAEVLLLKRIAARKRAERQVSVARERLRKQIVASYVTGGDDGGGTMAAFLNAQSGEEVGQALVYGHAVSGSTEALLRDLEDAEAARTRASNAANRVRKQAQSARDEIRNAAQFLLLARQQQQQLVTDVSVKLLTEADALREVQGQKAVIEGQIASMNHASDGVAMILADLQQDQPPWKPGSVEITTPIPGVKVSSGFGPRLHPILGITRLHAGADLGAPSGTEIHAAADGVVVLAEVRGGYGNAVVIDHGNSLATLYGHTSKMLVTAGQIVKRGDVIALVGTTGLSTGPHLHFETRIKGLPIDPEGVVDFNQVIDYTDLPDN